MITDFNDGWQFRHPGKGNWTVVTLPHDAMIGESRSALSAGGTNCCWFEGHDYEYVKSFFIPEEYSDKAVTFEFEGVYRNAEVYINRERAAYRPYGYTNFYVPADKYLKYGESNLLRVVAKNSDQPNSRWYSGAGIYRPVRMYVKPAKHILLNGIKIKTVHINPAIIEVNVKLSHSGRAEVSILEGDKIMACDSCECDGNASFLFELKEGKLWSPESPVLYTCEVKYCNDIATERFGIRTVLCNASDGFCLNGKRVILRGACIHHDNGILGARCYEEAEYRKIKLLKEAGYNAIRSAHNPCSKAMLSACDSLGMMVLDEYADMWYIHKTKYDYAGYVTDWYERDITDMVDKDYNHPSVIMYSLGNEVAETGEEKGINLLRSMYAVCKRLDDRPVTAGINIFFNLLYSLGFGVYSDKKAIKNSDKKVGSEFFNNLAGIFGSRFMKKMAKLYACDLKTRDCFAVMDVAGYNYGILRYEKDLKKYPERVILGTETFCSDAYTFMEIAKRHNAVIGDFVWSGMDYLGELGVGSWEYKEYAPDFSHGTGWMTAGCGRLDLTGTELGEALYTKVAFGLEDRPQIAVVPVNHTGEKHSPSAWKFSNAIPSWSWNGLDGKTAKVEVYSRAPIIQLYINGKRAGRKKFKNNCRFNFKVKYESGEITAINLDKSGKELSRNSLITAGEETVLSVLPEKNFVKQGEICFVRLRFTDKTGILKPLVHAEISVKTEGGTLIALGNACPFNVKGYMGNVMDSYYGEAMAVVKATSDHIKICAESGTLKGEAGITVR